MAPVVLERPKMSRPMWDALKTHIMRERQRKKQELEADAEVERQRMERERQQKQHVLTLSETKDQIAASEVRLSELKEEKHQLFLQLKKVLNEDEIRKRQLNQEAANEMMMRQFNNYGPPPRMQLLPPESQSHHPVPQQQQQQQAPPPPPPQSFMPPIQMTRAPVSISQQPSSQQQQQQQQQQQVFKLGGHPNPTSQQQQQKSQIQNPSHHNTSPHAPIPITIKRARSPSPPPQSHNYRFGPFKPPPQAIPQYAHQSNYQLEKPPNVGGLQYFHPPGPGQGPPVVSAPPILQHQQPPHVSFSPVVAHGPQPGLYTYANTPPSRSPQQPPRDEPPKHVASPMFIHHGAPLPRGYVIHQVEHSRSSPHKYPTDDGPKYYPPPTHGLGLRGQSHLSIHPGLSLPPNQNVPSGSITSGYPIRTQPNSYQGRPPSPQVSAYTVPPRLAYGHAQLPPQHQHQPIQRYSHSLPPGSQRD